jgi:CBS domain-containing protein
MGQLMDRVSRPVVTVTPETPVSEAVWTMVNHGIGAVLVVQNGRAEGIFTERDLALRVVVPGLDPCGTPISAVMTRSLVLVSESADEADVAEVMAARHIRHVPVVDGAQRPLGMLSFRDVLMDRVEELRKEIEALEEYAGPG